MVILNENLLGGQSDLIALREKYSFIFENSNAIEQYMNSDKGMLQLSEQDQTVIIDKAEDFITDANKFIDEVNQKKNKKINAARVHMFIGIGFGIASVLLTLSIIGILLAILTTLASLIFLLIALIVHVSANKEKEKLKDYQDQLLKMRAKTNNEKIRNQIDLIVDRIREATTK